MYKYNRNYFETIDTEEKAYWLGFIAADGCVAKNLSHMRINLNVKDKDHLEKFKQSIDGEQPILDSIREKNISVYIDMSSKKVCQDLIKYGITPKKSLTLDITFNLIPDSLIHHFIRGYFDGDGSINYYTRPPYYYDEWELSFISTEKVLNEFKKYIGVTHKNYTCGQNFRFCLKRKEEIRKALLYMYHDATIYMERKYIKALEFLKPSETTKGHPNKDDGIVQTPTN